MRAVVSLLCMPSIVQLIFISAAIGHIIMMNYLIFDICTRASDHVEHYNLNGFYCTRQTKKLPTEAKI